MKTRLTERDLSRIVRRVIVEDDTEMKDDCENKAKKVYSNPTFKNLRKKIGDYQSLEWWEWYDKLTLAPTVEDYKKLADFHKEYLRIMIDCKNKNQINNRL